MIKLLIPDNGRESELTSSEQAVLCRVMVATVRKAMGEDIVPKQRGEHNIRESAVSKLEFQKYIHLTHKNKKGSSKKKSKHYYKKFY